MRISDWSSDVCSSDLQAGREAQPALPEAGRLYRRAGRRAVQARSLSVLIGRGACPSPQQKNSDRRAHRMMRRADPYDMRLRSEEHTSELQSLMRISYADFRLKKKIKQQQMYQMI